MTQAGRMRIVGRGQTAPRLAWVLFALVLAVGVGASVWVWVLYIQHPSPISYRIAEILPLTLGVPLVVLALFWARQNRLFTK